VAVGFVEQEPPEKLTLPLAPYPVPPLMIFTPTALVQLADVIRAACQMPVGLWPVQAVAESLANTAFVTE
jgi:hypothetical protein